MKNNKQEFWRAVPYYKNLGIAPFLRFNEWDTDRIKIFTDLGWTPSQNRDSTITLVPPVKEDSHEG